MRTLLSVISLLAIAPCYGARSEFNYATASPKKKDAAEVSISKNPFQAGQEPEKPLPMLKDKDDPVAKLPLVIAPRLRSVVRQPRALVMIDGKVYQIGDEVKIGRESPIKNYRVVLKSVGSDRLFFNLTSLDVQQPGQVEATVPIPNEMR